jgi:frataxin-like iron-binding protein CyaY
MGALPQRRPRREVRVRQNLNLVLFVKSENGEKKQHATTVDLAEHGLRISTRGKLSEGQTVYAFSRQGGYHFGSCRVVWTSQQKESQLGEAGLEVMK